MAAAFQLTMEMLSGPTARARRLDPSGESSLHLAKRMRLDVMRNRLPSDQGQLVDLAGEKFGLPQYDLGFWEASLSQRPWHDRNGGPDPKRAASGGL